MAKDEIDFVIDKLDPQDQLKIAKGDYDNISFTAAVELGKLVGLEPPEDERLDYIGRLKQFSPAMGEAFEAPLAGVKAFGKGLIRQPLESKEQEDLSKSVPHAIGDILPTLATTAATAYMPGIAGARLLPVAAKTAYRAARMGKPLPIAQKLGRGLTSGLAGLAGEETSQAISALAGTSVETPATALGKGIRMGLGNMVGEGVISAAGTVAKAAPVVSELLNSVPSKALEWIAVRLPKRKNLLEIPESKSLSRNEQKIYETIPKIQDGLEEFRKNLGERLGAAVVDYAKKTRSAETGLDLSEAANAAQKLLESEGLYNPTIRKISKAVTNGADRLSAIINDIKTGGEQVISQAARESTKTDVIRGFRQGLIKMRKKVSPRRLAEGRAPAFPGPLQDIPPVKGPIEYDPWIAWKFKQNLDETVKFSRQGLTEPQGSSVENATKILSGGISDIMEKEAETFGAEKFIFENEMYKRGIEKYNKIAQNVQTPSRSRTDILERAEKISGEFFKDGYLSYTWSTIGDDIVLAGKKYIDEPVKELLDLISLKGLTERPTFPGETRVRAVVANSLKYISSAAIRKGFAIRAVRPQIAAGTRAGAIAATRGQEEVEQ